MTNSAFGDHLRRERELRGIPLEEVCASTRISMHFLEALENGDWNELPGGVFRRGFIRSIARFLGLDEESMVAEYALETNDSAQPATVQVAGFDRRHWLLSLCAAIILLVIVALAVYIHVDRGKAPRSRGNAASAGAAHVSGKTPPARLQPAAPAAKAALSADASNQNRANPPAPGPSISDFSGPVAAGTIAGAQPKAPDIPTSAGPFSLHIKSTRPTRVRVTADGRNVFEGPMAAGKWHDFRASKRLRLFAADGGAVVAQLNGKPVGAGGVDGRPLRLAYPPPR